MALEVPAVSGLWAPEVAPSFLLLATSQSAPGSAPGSICAPGSCAPGSALRPGQYTLRSGHCAPGSI